MREVYKRLGVFEPEDQTEFANHLINNKAYNIDKDNVAIWGWVNFSLCFFDIFQLNVRRKLKNYEKFVFIYKYIMKQYFYPIY